jgi:hypothetical protein
MAGVIVFVILKKRNTKQEILSNPKNPTEPPRQNPYANNVPIQIPPAHQQPPSPYQNPYRSDPPAARPIVTARPEPVTPSHTASEEVVAVVAKPKKTPKEKLKAKAEKKKAKKKVDQNAPSKVTPVEDDDEEEVVVEDSSEEEETSQDE